VVSIREKFFYPTVALFWFALYVYVPFLSPYLMTIGIAATTIGLVAGVYGVSQLILRIPLGILGRIAGNHKLIIGIGLLLSCFTFILPLFSHSWVCFFITRLLAGAACSTWINYTAYMLEGAGSSANRRMGYVMACNTGGICLSQFVGMLFYEHIGINGLFIIASAASGVAFLLLLLTPFYKGGVNGDLTGAGAPDHSLQGGETEIIQKNAGENSFSAAMTMFAEVIKNRQLWLCSIIMSLSWWVLFSTNYSFTGVYAKDVLGTSGMHLGLIAFVAQVASVATSLSLGRLGKYKLPERKILVVAFLFAAVYALLTPFCRSDNALVALQIVGGITYAIPNVLLFANAGRELSDKQQILSMGVFQSVYSFGMVFGPAITGILYDLTGSYVIAFAQIAFIALFAAFLTFLQYRDSK